MPTSAPNHDNIIHSLQTKSDIYSSLGLTGTAQFFSDKALTFNQTPTERINLARLYISDGNYRRALHLLSKNSLHERNPTAKLLAAQCLLQLEQLEQCLTMLGEESEEEVLINTSLSGLTIENPSQVPAEVQAALCVIRAKVHHRMENASRAAFWYKCALRCDKYCMDAFIELTKSYLITRDEALSFITEINNDANLSDKENEQLSNWMKHYYHAATDKHVDLPRTTDAMSKNIDIRRIEAQRRYDALDFPSTVKICKEILDEDPFADERIMIIHLAALMELERKQELFVLAHTLVERDPKSGVSWLAVGYYYYTCEKPEVARGFFQKATQLQPTLAPAWVAVGHAFGAQDESDQAMAAYRTAYRLFPGAQLPMLFMGMEYVRQSSLSQASLLLQEALQACPSDPAPRHELGVVMYRRGDKSRAAAYFKEALCLWRESDTELGITIATGKRAQAEETTLINLGHCYRMLKEFQRAKWCYERALGLNPRSHVTCTALGITLHSIGDIHGAVAMYHRALRNHPEDPHCNELLERALHDMMHTNVDIGLDVEAGSTSKVENDRMAIVWGK